MATGKKAAVRRQLGKAAQKINTNILNQRTKKEYTFTVNPEYIEELIQQFRRFDTNGDNGLDTRELEGLMRYLGQNPTKAQLQQIMTEADTDGNGKIDEREYLQLLLKHMKSPEQVEDELKDAFNVFDFDSTGFLTVDKLKKVLKMVGVPIGDKEIEPLFRRMDKDNDSEVDIEEFVEFLCKPVDMERIKRKVDSRLQKTK